MLSLFAATTSYVLTKPPAVALAAPARAVAPQMGVRATRRRANHLRGFRHQFACQPNFRDARALVFRASSVPHTCAQRTQIARRATASTPCAYTCRTPGCAALTPASRVAHLGNAFVLFLLGWVHSSFGIIYAGRGATSDEQLFIFDWKKPSFRGPGFGYQFGYRFGPPGSKTRAVIGTRTWTQKIHG